MPALATDHIVINVRDQMDAAVDAYRRLGFFLTERGHHTLGSINHLLIFASDYVELIGFEPGAQNVRTDILRFPIGLNAVVFRTDDPVALHQELVARQLPAQEPVAFSRPVMVDGVEKEASFRSVRLAPGTVPSGRVYFCQHLTPELVWRPEWQQHPNGASGVSKAIIVAPDPEDRAGLFAKLFGADAVTGAADHKRIDAPGITIEIVRQGAVARAFGSNAPDGGGRDDYMAVLELVTVSLDRTEDALRERGVPSSRQDDRLVVPASEAFNVTLRFVERARAR
jgi:hypothetical protein